jgi:hypothetical protein
MIYMRKQLMQLVMVCMFLMVLIHGIVTAATEDSMDGNAITSRQPENSWLPLTVMRSHFPSIPRMPMSRQPRVKMRK